MRNCKFKSADITFAVLPSVIISAASVACYILRLFDAAAADGLFFVIFSAAVCLAAVLRVRKTALKIISALLCAFYIAAYFTVGGGLFELAADKLNFGAYAFGAFDFLFNTAGIFDYDRLILFTSYGGARLVDSQIICGVSNIAAALPDSDTVYYLSGRVLLIFFFFGVMLSDKRFFKLRLLLCALMLISGNPAPVLIFLLLTKPTAYFISLFFSTCCHAAAAVFEIRAAYAVSPSVYEIAIHSQNAVLVFAVGILILSCSYFISRLVSERKK